MDRVQVQSSHIAEIGYDSTTMTLEIAFKDGGVYQYYDVPEVVYHELMNAESKGKFLNAQIMHSYRYTKV